MSLQAMSLQAMSLQECTRALIADGAVRIDAGEFSQADLEDAAAAAREARARLIIYNLKGRSCADVGRIAEAGGRHVTLGDLHLI
jgi:hypothetical protein